MLIRTIMISTALTFAMPAFAQEAGAPVVAASQPSNIIDPTEFATMASVSNLFEIESSTVAIERAESGEVKAFAEQMIADHTKAAQDMISAASEEGIAPATDLDERHQQMIDDLNGLEGAEFDAAYIQAQIAAHDEAVALFEGYSSNGAEGALKEFAVATLPTLKQHQEHVRGVPNHSH